MADFVFNYGKGRVAELHKRVDEQDPATSRLVVFIARTAGIEGDAILIDKETVAAIFSGPTTEPANTGYNRKILTEADLVAFAPDHANDRVQVTIPNQTWTAVQAGDGWSAFMTAFDKVTPGADAALEPMTKHDMVVVPDGSDITAQINADGIFRAA